jgi:hypothetical protein
MSESECTDCGQVWLVLPGEIAHACCQACRDRRWREQQAAQKAHRAALRAGAR